MTTAGWIMLAVAACVGAMVLIGIGIGRIVFCRDFELEAVVQAEMDGVDAEYDDLCKGNNP